MKPVQPHDHTSFSRGGILPGRTSAGATANTAVADLAGAYQPLDADLTALAALTSAADTLPYFTGSGTAGTTPLTAAGRALIDDANAAAQLVTLGAAPSTADYLVGTAQSGLSAEIVVGTTPGGELGGTWASPTVDPTHSGSAHILEHTHAATGQGATGGGATLAPGTFTIPGGGKLSAGSSFPGSPASGDRCWRTDRLMEYVYDGTRWLSTTVFQVSASTTGSGITATTLMTFFPMFGAADALWLVDMRWVYAVYTTHTVTQYWTATVHSWESTGAVDTVMATMTTDQSSVGVNVNPAASVLNALVAASYEMIYLQFDKVSTPGALTAGMVLNYRRVG